MVHSNDICEWEKLIDEDTRFLYGEMPSNPGQAFFDLKEVIDLAHRHNIPVIIDNTVATPELMRPLALGADIVVQSVSKTLNTTGYASGQSIPTIS